MPQHTFKLDAADLVAFVSDGHKDAASRASEQERIRATIIAALGALGGMTVGDDDIAFEGDKIVLPASYEGRVPDAIDYLKRYYEGQEKHYTFSRTYNFRPWDGANAFRSAMMSHFGTAGLGASTFSLFGGEQPPQLVTVKTGVDTTVQVPWGQVEFPPLNATFTLDATMNRDYGLLFMLKVKAPKKYRRHLDAFMQLVQEELTHRSIYKGKAITGGTEPAFLDIARLDPKTVVYSEDVITQLDANLWSLLKHTEVMRELRLPLKRAVLVEGPYGTGKTLAGMLTAQIAAANGWTYILCRTGDDDLGDVLKTAQLYAPAVVWFEDIDTVAKGGTDDEISELLDMLDGITSKGCEVVAGFTTNHVEKIQRAVLRPGRLDAIIHIAELDAAGFEKLIRNLVPARLLGKIDYQLVGKAFVDFLPAFAAEAINRAMRYSIARNNGTPDKVTTDDLVNAALGLRPQLDLMRNAAEGPDTTSLDSKLRDLLADIVNHTEFTTNPDGDSVLSYDPETVPAVA